MRTLVLVVALPLLTEQQFEVLRAKIEAEDLSLQQIEGYVPD